MQQPSWSMKQLRRRGLALLPCRCLQPLHGALTWGPHDHQRGSATGRDTLGSEGPSGWLRPKFPMEEAAGRSHSGRSSPAPSLEGRQAPSLAGGVVLERPVLSSWELGTPNLPSSCWGEDDIRFGKCLSCGEHRAGAHRRQRGLHPRPLWVGMAEAQTLRTKQARSHLFT